MTFDCVLDASVGVKLFLLEPLSDRAEALFNHLTDAPPARFYVPDLFFVECANVLWKYVQHFGYSPDAARQDVSDLIRLPLRVISTMDLVLDALELGTAYGITAYDAVYVALSRRLSLPLVTADETLVHRVKGTDLDVRSLSVWP